MQTSFRGDLATGELTRLAESDYGAFPAAVTHDHRRAIITDAYTVGDEVLFLREEGSENLRLISGVPINQRTPGQQVPLTGINIVEFTPGEDGLLVLCAVFEDSYGPAFLDMSNPQAGYAPVQMVGVQHSGTGEMVDLRKLKGNCFVVAFNIDGCSWLYEASFDQSFINSQA